MARAMAASLQIFLGLLIILGKWFAEDTLLPKQDTLLILFPLSKKFWVKMILQESIQ